MEVRGPVSNKVPSAKLGNDCESKVLTLQAFKVVEVHLNDDAQKTAQFRHFLLLPADMHKTAGLFWFIDFCSFEH